MGVPVIEVVNLQKSYGDNNVLSGINFQVERGALLALLGPNGAGKTTSVRILSTLLSFDAGRVTIGGYDLSAEPEAVRSIIGLTGQAVAVDETLTGYENLVMMGRLSRLTIKSARARAEELLQGFNLTEAANRKVGKYSGGMRRRLDLAVSLVTIPPIIFLDEPTAGLDPRSRLVMWGMVQQLLAQGRTIVLTTQDLEEADRLADHIVIIDNGKVIAEGISEELKAKVGHGQLELTFENSIALNNAVALLTDSVIGKTGVSTGVVEIFDISADITRVLDLLQAAKIKILNIELHKPTLDDAFIALTSTDAKDPSITRGQPEAM
jgi:ABC-2 type transport system ATP-binding protein